MYKRQVEDHSVIGGLGSAVSEYLSENNPTKIRKIGVEDRFGESGDSEELLSLVGLTVESIETASRAMLKIRKFLPQYWVVFKNNR